MSSMWTWTSRGAARRMQSGDRLGLEADAVPDVEREAERVRAAEPPVERLEVVEPLDEHARLGLEAEPDAAPLGVRDDALGPPRAAAPTRPPGARFGGAAPDHSETTGAPELGGDVDRAAEHPHALPRPSDSSVGKCLRRGSSAKRAPVSTTHVEPELVEQRAQRSPRAQASRRVGIEVHVVERERHAVVAVSASSRTASSSRWPTSPFVT